MNVDDKIDNGQENESDSQDVGRITSWIDKNRKITLF